MNKKDRKKSILILILLLLAIITSYIFITYSKYATEQTNSDIAYVAQFVFTETMSENLNVKLENMKPGDIQNYHFTVSNTRNTKISDVGMNYEITLQSSSNLPLTIYLYKNDDNTTNLFSETAESTVQQKVLKTQKQSFIAGEEKTDTYTLKIEWQNTEENKNEKYVDEIDYMDISIDAVQAQPLKN